MPNRSTTELRKARHVRLRKRIQGTTVRPRLAVFRSLQHIYAQIIDDSTGTTLASASSQEKELKASGNAEGAKKVGLKLAERAKEKGIQAVIFDRGGFRYHGRVANLAEGAREGGLEF
ncbi:MAG TPA: 50S ribosomal protein L18 [Fimbriimonadaceae bacterium]|nr:50S ribosomal protein L18 [Fimbriimonadaceae bacterium]